MWEWGFTTFDWCVFYDHDCDCVFIRVNFYGLGEILKNKRHF